MYVLNILLTSFDVDVVFLLMLDAMMYPTVDSKNQTAKMRANAKSPNRLQDIWIWNGRPMWDDVFKVRYSCYIVYNLRVCFCLLRFFFFFAYRI